MLHNQPQQCDICFQSLGPFSIVRILPVTPVVSLSGTATPIHARTPDAKKCICHHCRQSYSNIEPWTKSDETPLLSPELEEKEPGEVEPLACPTPLCQFVIFASIASIASIASLPIWKHCRCWFSKTYKTDTLTLDRKMWNECPTISLLFVYCQIFLLSSLSWHHRDYATADPLDIFADYRQIYQPGGLHRTRWHRKYEASG